MRQPAIQITPPHPHPQSCRTRESHGMPAPPSPRATTLPNCPWTLGLRLGLRSEAARACAAGVIMRLAVVLQRCPHYATHMAPKWDAAAESGYYCESCCSVQ